MTTSRLEIVYREGKSFFHSISPLNKLVYVLCVSMMMAIYFDVYIQVSMLVLVTFISLVFTRVPFIRYWGFLKYVFVFMLTIGITTMLFIRKPGPVVLSTPFRDFSFRELTDGLTMGLQFFNLGWVSLSFVFTTHPRDMTRAMTKMGLEYRLAHGFVLGLVFLPIILTEAVNVSNSQKIRDLGANMNRLKRGFLRFKHLAFTLVVRVLRRAETIAIAMDVKGFGNSKSRTYFKECPHRFLGGIFSIACVLALVSVILISPPGADNRWSIWFNGVVNLFR